MEDERRREMKDRGLRGSVSRVHGIEAVGVGNGRHTCE